MLKNVTQLEEYDPVAQALVEEVQCLSREEQASFRGDTFAK